MLEEIKADKELERIPVIILTTSKSEEDIRAMYDLHADAYINKPVDIDHFIKVVKCIEAFWIEIVALPGGETEEHLLQHNRVLSLLYWMCGETGILRGSRMDTNTN